MSFSGIFIEEVIVERCLICNPEARAQLDERVRRFMEELVADRPATAIHGIVCLFWQWADWR